MSKSSITQPSNEQNPFLTQLLNSTQSSNSTQPYPVLKHHHAYGERKRVALTFPAQGRTKQSFKDECDINKIMARYAATGVLEHTKEAMPQFLDVTDVMDYQMSMDTIANANSLFAELPAQLRDRFENDPRKLLEFVHDPRNLEEAVSLGFLNESLLEAVKPSQGDPGAIKPSSSLNPAPSQTADAAVKS